MTPPGDADRVAAAFTGSRRVGILRVDGGGRDGGSGRDCGSVSPHGYRGMERELVDRVAGWLERWAPPLAARPARLAPRS